ncbi:hypothetical protein [Rhodococcus sp. Leaf278]|uniref:hypothetical protein n=1 Tax=Rhodococcus sp. Leaf278 TaxID=1736319 RepID=UPI0009E6D720|nr:hypothetical protein [Rhodococcus sp. Leaf278]
MMPREREDIGHYILAGYVTVAEAQWLQMNPPHRSVVRDLRDNLLVHLSAYPLGEAGPRSGLAELQVFGSAIEREPEVWAKEMDDRVGRHMIAVGRTVTRESREQARWDMLLPLGSPSTDRWQAAINVFTRVISSRAVDGLIHPVLAANSICGWPIPGPLNQPDVPGIAMIGTTKRLFDSWKDDRSRRDEIEQDMMDAFHAGTWS